MIDIYNALTGTLGPTQKIRFRAYLWQGDYGHGERKEVFWTWIIDVADPRFDRPGYKPNVSSDHHTSTEAAERQLRSVLEDFGAVYDPTSKKPRNANALRQKRWRELHSKRPVTEGVTV